MKLLLKSLETNHRTTTAYHPRANGLMERLNDTLSDRLSMYVSMDHQDWEAPIPFVTFAYNTSRQETTGKTPIFLMHGREALLPIDVTLGADPNTEGVWDGVWGAKEELARAKNMVENRMK